MQRTISKSRLPLLLLATLGLVGAPLPSLADNSDDVQQLLANCRMELGAPMQLYCIGYIAGIGDMMGVNGALLHRSSAGNSPVGELFGMMSTCSPEAVSLGAKVQAFKNWAEKHPERWSESRQTGVMAALRETWPCK